MFVLWFLVIDVINAWKYKKLWEILSRSKFRVSGYFYHHVEKVINLPLNVFKVIILPLFQWVITLKMAFVTGVVITGAFFICEKNDPL